MLQAYEIERDILSKKKGINRSEPRLEVWRRKSQKLCVRGLADQACNDLCDRQGLVLHVNGDCVSPQKNVAMPPVTELTLSAASPV